MLRWSDYDRAVITWKVDESFDLLHNLVGSIWHLLSRAVLVDTAILVAVAFIILMSGPWSERAFSTGLFWGGALAVTHSVGIVSGGFRGRGSFNYQYGQSVGETDHPGRTPQEATYTSEGHGWMDIFALAGAAAIGLRFMVPSLF